MKFYAEYRNYFDEFITSIHLNIGLAKSRCYLPTMSIIYMICQKSYNIFDPVDYCSWTRQHMIAYHIKFRHVININPWIWNNWVFFFHNWVLFSDVHYKYNTILWNWLNAMHNWSALWILMAWCFSTKSSVATVLIMNPSISRCLWVNIGHSLTTNFKAYLTNLSFWGQKISVLWWPW